MRVFTAALSCLAVIAQNPSIPQWRALNNAARAAIEAKDYAKLRETLLALKPLQPGNPRIAYNFAASEAMLGHREAAIAALRTWAGMGLVYDLAADDDFSSLRGSPEFNAILALVEVNKKPVVRAKEISKIQEKDLLPEDIAYDPRTHRFFISSVHAAKIITTDALMANQITFTKTDWPVLALRVDATRRVLWAATGWVPHCNNCLKTDEGKTALLAFHLDSGALKQRIDSPVPGLLGDMTISRTGDIYVSEGIHGAVFRLAQGAAALERLDKPDEFPSPQTPALSADEKTLYIPDYARGIAALKLSDRSVRWLQPADNIALTGIDGLYVYGDSFIAVQNGTTPARVIRFSLNLQHQEVLESNSPGLGEPTHGVLVKNVFWFLANTGWSAYDEQGKKKAGSAAVESSVRSISLK